MKFAHLADTHLGYRQFGLIEREKDFYEVFEKVIDKIIEEKEDILRDLRLLMNLVISRSGIRIPPGAPKKSQFCDFFYFL